MKLIRAGEPIEKEDTSVRAQILRSFGDPSKFELTELPRPQARPGTVLIRVAATSVNQVDLKMLGGLPIAPDLPAILGADVAGTVEEAGAGVMGFAAGDEVYGCAGGVKGQQGALAEYMVADARLLAAKPRSLAMHEAAALPLVAITAWDALERAAISASDHVLVHGGVGGVGHIAVQLAKTMGARVATTVPSSEAAVLARQLGADEAINYHEETVPSYLSRVTAGRGFDFVFDTIGGNNLPSSFAATAYEGRVATTNARTTQDLGELHARALSFYVVFMLLPMLRGVGRERHGRILSSLARLVEAGKIKPLIDDSKFTLATAPDAYRWLASGKAHGKVIIDIADDASRIAPAGPRA
jgi:NADPH:quinone reductase